MENEIKGKVLIVEDEQLCANLLQTFLEQMGFETATLAGDGDEAIRIAGAERPDLALMDMNLQGELSGLETAQAIFSQFGIPSLFVSGYPKEDIAAAMAGEWSLGYVSKPYDLDQLEKMIVASLGEARKKSAPSARA